VTYKSKKFIKTTIFAKKDQQNVKNLQRSGFLQKKSTKYKFKNKKTNSQHLYFYSTFDCQKKSLSFAVIRKN
jgi:hypothetical protein